MSRELVLLPKEKYEGIMDRINNLTCNSRDDQNSPKNDDKTKNNNSTESGGNQEDVKNDVAHLNSGSCNSSEIDEGCEQAGSGKVDNNNDDKRVQMTYNKFEKMLESKFQKRRKSVQGGGGGKYKVKWLKLDI